MGLWTVSPGQPWPAQASGGSGDDSVEATALLLGGAAPHAVPLPVLQRPGQAEFTDRADGAIGEGQAGLLLGGGEEDLGVEAVAGGALLPMVGRGDFPGRPR